MMIGMSSARGLLLLAILTIPAVIKAQGPEPGQPKLSGLESTAELVGVLPELTQLRKVAAGAASADRWEILWRHQHISERVMAASLQVDATIAQIDNEISRANELHSYLADRRDRSVNRANLLSVIVGGGLGATSSGLQLSSTLTKPAAGVGIGAGALSASLAIFGIHAQKGSSSRFDFESNMLAEFFDRPVLPDSQYPATVWTFLNESAPSSPTAVTRKQQLMQTWITSNGSIRSQAQTKFNALPVSHLNCLNSLSIDDLEDRAAMLQDVRARISFLKRDLGVLVASLPRVDAFTEAKSQPFSSAP